MDKLLLHSCCAPCSVYCVDTLRADGIEPTSLWFNPNIHPWTEYDARRRTLLEYGEKEHVEVHILEDYGLRDFVRAVSADIDHRCAHCYTIRLGTAGYIGIKVNAMNDADIMAQLVRASAAGTEVELFVRGICCLRPGVPGRTEHISVRSIIGRYLEHERIFVFGRGEAQKVFICSSATPCAGSRRLPP